MFHCLFCKRLVMLWKHCALTKRKTRTTTCLLERIRLSLDICIQLGHNWHWKCYFCFWFFFFLRSTFYEILDCYRTWRNLFSFDVAVVVNRFAVRASIFALSIANTSNGRCFGRYHSISVFISFLSSSLSLVSQRQLKINSEYVWQSRIVFIVIFIRLAPPYTLIYSICRYDVCCVWSTQIVLTSHFHHALLVILRLSVWRECVCLCLCLSIPIFSSSLQILKLLNYQFYGIQWDMPLSHNANINTKYSKVARHFTFVQFMFA